MSKGSLPAEIDSFLQRLNPWPRSLTGDGNRETLRILQEIAPIELSEYSSGTPVYDWVIPEEWSIRDAYIKGPDGDRLVDFKESNLHVVSYSEPVHERMTFDVLAPRLHVLQQNPDVIPYRTSYYSRDWGFCVTGKQRESLQNNEGLLEVCIDTELNPSGSMTIGSLCVPGLSDEEYLISTYCCHPSMANDNLSGLMVTALLAREMVSRDKPKKSWRFIFVPETIGSIAYLCHNEPTRHLLHHGLVVTKIRN
jgi:aminopeptidase-like protein